VLYVTNPAVPLRRITQVKQRYEGNDWMLTRTGRWIVAVIAALALAVGGAGVAFAGHHHRHHHSGIPQHNGGDHDADNNGGPSDGDGLQ
jgi:hypothetical protein